MLRYDGHFVARILAEQVGRRETCHTGTVVNISSIDQLPIMCAFLENAVLPYDYDITIRHTLPKKIYVTSKCVVLLTLVGNPKSCVSPATYTEHRRMTQEVVDCLPPRP